MLDATVSINGFANVVTEGLLAGLDTSAAGTEGDPVWLGANGNLLYGVANKPSAPLHMVFIGVVTRKNQNNGEIFVKVQNGFELLLAPVGLIGRQTALYFESTCRKAEMTVSRLFKQLSNDSNLSNTVKLLEDTTQITSAQFMLLSSIRFLYNE